MEALLQAGRSVVLAGDLNIAPFPIDHCDLVRASRAEQESMLRARADRAWFRNALQSAEGPFVDLFRCMQIFNVLPPTIHGCLLYGSETKVLLSAGNAACSTACKNGGEEDMYTYWTGQPCNKHASGCD